MLVIRKWTEMPEFQSRELKTGDSIHYITEIGLTKLQCITEIIFKFYRGWYYEQAANNKAFKIKINRTEKLNVIYRNNVFVLQWYRVSWYSKIFWGKAKVKSLRQNAVKITNFFFQRHVFQSLDAHQSFEFAVTLQLALQLRLQYLGFSIQTYE